METEKTKEIRKEFCSIKGWNYLEFDCLEDAEEYIIFLESKVNHVVLDCDNCTELNRKTCFLGFTCPKCNKPFRSIRS